MHQLSRDCRKQQTARRTDNANIKPRIHSQAIGNLDKQHQYPKKDQSHEYFCNFPSTIFILDVHMDIRKAKATRS